MKRLLRAFIVCALPELFGRMRNRFTSGIYSTYRPVWSAAAAALIAPAVPRLIFATTWRWTPPKSDKSVNLKILLTIAVLASAVLSTRAQNLVVNPGFETGDFTGWTVSGDTSFTAVNGVMPHSGNFSEQSGPSSSDGFTDQTIPTSAATAYNVSFWLANQDTSNDNRFGVSFGSVTLVPEATMAEFGYTQFSFTNVVPGANADLHFIFYNPSSYFYLDDVEVLQSAGPPPPLMVTHAATNVTSSSATLNGTVNPNGLTTTVYFQYGTTTSYGSTTTSQNYTGNTTQTVNANITGLSPSTTYHFRVVGTYNGGTSYGSDMTFTTLSAAGAPQITSPATARATAGQLFVYQITATNTPTSYTATPLPAGMSLDSVSGTLGGVPANSGTTQVQLTASNSAGTGMKTLTLTVQPVPSSGPIISSGTSITARTSQPFSFEVFTTSGNETARLMAAGLPPGLSADPVTGVISGTPTADGSFGVTLNVTEGSVTFTSTLQLTFTSDPVIPVITSPREATLTIGQFFTYSITTDSSDRSGTTFSLIGNLPLGLGFDAATGTISGIYNPGDQNGGALLGNVQLVATNSSGSATSPLSFFQGVSATAVNISTRLAVGTNDNVLIGGFIVTGNAPKKVIVRAVGPSLTAYHVPGALQDPMLELHNGTGALIARNDDWHTTQIGGLITAKQVAEIQASGLAPSDHRESAMIVTLAQHTGGPTSLTGNYTAIVRGKNGTTGVALVEAYDLGTASLDTSSNAQLANISTRGMVQTGDNVMIGGFIVRGDMSPTVVVRAIGPSLAQHGITNPLQDPTLELHDHNGTLIAFNDNWMSAPNRQAIINSGLAPSNNLESAILRSLSPGNYTAIVRGKNATGGIALVEAYVLP